MGEWIEVKFGDFAKGIRGVSYKPDDLIDIYNYDDDTFILLRANNIQNNSIIFDDIQIVTSSIVNKNQKAAAGDIAVCMSNGSKKLVGKTASIPECSKNLTVGAFCSIFKPNDAFDIGFIKYQFQSQNYQRQLDITLAGSTINNLRNNQIETFKAYVPKEKTEQSKIAEILKTIDDTIEQTEKIIAKYRRIKQGLLQDLLTKGIDENGNIRSEATHKFKDSPLGRIPVEWEFGTIGEVAKVRRGASPRPIDNPEYFSDIGRGWVRITDVTNAYKFLLKTSQYMSLLGESLSVKVNKGELILSICATVGKPIILGIDACIHDGFVHIYDYQKRIDRDYLFYFLDYNQEKIKLKSQIGTQGNLNTDIVKNIELIIPPYKEQLTISETLTNIDNNLDIEQKNLKKLHSIKQGLMQDLLTGKVRVTHLLNKGGKSDECHP